jgi:signal peptidase II
VRDFVDVVLWGWHYPTFNVADMALVVGILLLLVGSFLHGPRREKAPAKP